ncbi:MAG: hypothetical protein ACK45U_01580 [bacterium]|jgi:hypothetical protein
MRLKKTYIYICVLIFSVIITSEDAMSQRGFSTSKFVFGGNFGANFSNQESVVAIAPSVGYRFTERLTIGTGFIYQYYAIKLPGFNFKFNNYGTRFFGTYQLTEFLIAHAEYETLNLEYINFNSIGLPDGTSRRTINSTLVGGGYRQMIGRNAVVDLMLLYNLTETPYTPYSNPIIRVGFGVGL